MSQVSPEVQIRIAVIRASFNDPTINSLVQGKIEDLQVEAVERHLEMLQSGRTDNEQSVSSHDAKQATKLLARIASLKGIVPVVESAPSLSERIEADRERGSITRQALNLE